MTPLSHPPSRFNGPTLSLIAFSTALNLFMGQVAIAVKLPIYLDMIGTVFCAALSGFLPAAAAAAAANLLAAPLGSPSMVMFIPVGIAVAGLSTVAARIGAFRRVWTAALAGIAMGAAAATLSAPIAAYVFGGVMFSGTDLLVALFRGAGYSRLVSVWFQGLTSDTIDKAVTCALVAGVVADLPLRIRGRFRGGPYDTPASRRSDA